MSSFFKTIADHMGIALKIMSAFLISAFLISGILYYRNWDYKPGNLKENIKKHIENSYGINVKVSEIVVGAKINKDTRAVYFTGTKTGARDFYFIGVVLSPALIPVESSEPINISNTPDNDESSFSVYQDRAVYFDGKSLCSVVPVAMNMTMKDKVLHGAVSFFKNTGIWYFEVQSIYTPPEIWPGAFRLVSRNILEILTCDDAKKCLMKLNLKDNLSVEKSIASRTIKSNYSMFKRNLKKHVISIFSFF